MDLLFLVNNYLTFVGSVLFQIHRYLTNITSDTDSGTGAKEDYRYIYNIIHILKSLLFIQSSKFHGFLSRMSTFYFYLFYFCF